MNLAPTDYLNGILNTITVLISVIIGLIIVIKLFKYKKKRFLLIGIAIIGLYQPWWPGTVNFFLILMFDTTLKPAEHFLIATICIPFFIVLWMIAISDMLNLKNKKVLPIVFLFISLVGEIYIIYFAITDPNMIGTISRYFDVEYGIIVLIYLLIISTSIAITGILFAVQSLRAYKYEIRLKGKFIIIGFILYATGGFLDAGIIHLTTFLLIIARIILISSSIFLYFGFFLPNFIKKLFLKEQ